MDGTRGQASIETAVLLPLLLALGLGCWQALLVGWAEISAQHAARAAAHARLIGAPAVAAAERSLPGSMRDGFRATAADDAVVVHVRVPQVIPGFSMTVSADAAVVLQ
jgi:TadE-like protein